MTKFTPLVLGITGLSLALLADRGAPDDGFTSDVHGLDVLALAWTEPGPIDGNATIQRYCVRCHNDARMRGNMSLEHFDVEHPRDDWPLAEKIIRKLQAGMMPPPRNRRPEEATLDSLVLALETRLDASAEANPDPGIRTFQRLNRAEYERAVYSLLGLVIAGGDYLPLDTKSANFDNIADVQSLSPTLLDAYLNAAGEISRLAVGDPGASPAETTYRVPRYAEQREHVEGAPHGTRGGLSVIHTFPADGEYRFRLSFQHESTGNFFGQTAPFDEEIEVSIDGERVALLPLDRWMHVQDPTGVSVRTEPIAITAGPKRVSAAFVRNFEGPVDDLMSPHEWSLAAKKIGYSYGITGLPHLRDMAIGGPFESAGVSETPIRRRIFTCRPEGDADGAECARSILERLATQAYRRPLTPGDVDPLMDLYEVGERDGGFEVGVRTGLQGILASPDFVFRFEPATDATDGPAPIGDIALASRLSFFLWGAPPDDELLELARENRLSEPRELDRQVDRMLADPRSEALATRFAAQWLRLQDLDKVHPDAIQFPDFYQQLADAMVRETELFFHNLVTEDRSLLELLNADYSFINERLARHYGMPGVAGEHFRRVEYVDESRRGLLGHGSVLTLTSHANRTSPVLRGKWVMEVLLGTPPPPPPPDVPDLEATEGVADGRVLTVRERLEMHRANPTCNSCHQFIDPIGLALENFDVTGKWRIKDAGNPVDAEGTLYDGTPLTSPADLRQALLMRPEPFVRTFIDNLLAYALGRRVEYFDQPTVRRISRAAAAEDYRMSTFIRGVVESPAFRMRGAEDAVVQDSPDRDQPEG